MRIHMSIPKRILALCLVFAAGIGMGSLSGHFISENSRFETFTEKLFQSEVTSSTLTLHYTLTHPEKKGIKKPEVTLGTALSDPDKTTSLCQEYENKLKSFAYSKLSHENQLTCDMLLLYFHTRAALDHVQRRIDMRAAVAAHRQLADLAHVAHFEAADAS